MNGTKSDTEKGIIPKFFFTNKKFFEGSHIFNYLFINFKKTPPTATRPITGGYSYFIINSRRI